MKWHKAQWGKKPCVACICVYIFSYLLHFPVCLLSVVDVNENTGAHTHTHTHTSMACSYLRLQCSTTATTKVHKIIFIFIFSVFFSFLLHLVVELFEYSTLSVVLCVSVCVFVREKKRARYLCLFVCFRT